MTTTFSLQEKPTHILSDFEFIHDPNDKTAKLGVGSFASVKLAREKKTGKLVALKIINISPAKASASDIHNLKVEIIIHKRLEHENIIKFRGYIQQEPFVYLILDYAEHGNLYGYIHKNKRLSESEVFKYFHQACLAIHYLHKNDVMHRDLKPENLLLDKEYNLKLCDFGWSTQHINEKRMTFCGTYEYMAPEIVYKTPYDYRVDIWSLGILLHELFHREAPYKGRSLTEITKSLSKKTFSVSSSINPSAKDLILRILKINPIERLSLQAILDHPWMKSHASKDDGRSNSTLRINELSILNSQTLKINTEEEELQNASHPATTNSLYESTRHHLQTSSSQTSSQASLATFLKPNSAKPSSHHQHTHSATMLQTHAAPTVSIQPQSSSHQKTTNFSSLKVLTQASPPKINVANFVKSPSIGHFNGFNSGNLSSRELENKEGAGFVNYYDMIKSRDLSTRSSDVRQVLSSYLPKSHFASTTTNRSTKFAFPEQETHTTFTKNIEVFADQKSLIDNSNLSPNFRLKLNDIMSQLSRNSGSSKGDVRSSKEYKGVTTTIAQIKPSYTQITSPKLGLQSRPGSGALDQRNIFSPRTASQTPLNNIFGASTRGLSSSQFNDSRVNLSSSVSSHSIARNMMLAVPSQGEKSGKENTRVSSKIEQTATSYRNLFDVKYTNSITSPKLESINPSYTNPFKSLESKKIVGITPRGFSNKENRETNSQKMLILNGFLS